MARVLLLLLVTIAPEAANAFREQVLAHRVEKTPGCPADPAYDTKGDCIDASSNAKVEMKCCTELSSCKAGLGRALTAFNVRISLYFEKCGVTQEDFEVDVDRNYHLMNNDKVCSKTCQAVPGLSEEPKDFKIGECTGYSQLAAKLKSFTMLESIVRSCDGGFRACEQPTTTPKPYDAVTPPCDGQVFTPVQYDAVTAALHSDNSCSPGSCTCGPNPDGYYPVDWEGKILYPNKAGYYPSIYGHYPNADGCIPGMRQWWVYPDEHMIFPYMAGYSGSGKQPVEGGYDACAVVHEVDEWGQQK
jgi:hypothetical protein